MPVGQRNPGDSDSQESASSAGDPGLIPRLGRSPGEGNGYPLLYSRWRIPWTEGPSGLQSMGSLKGKCREKRVSQAVMQRKGKFIRGKQEDD